MSDSQHKICAILDMWAADDRARCPSIKLWTDGAEAMGLRLAERAHDLLLAEKLWREHPNDAIKLLRGVERDVQVIARTIDVAHRTGKRMED